ncbi:MAG: ribosome maturation factor RimP [Thiotrichaceae bacterium IS1]|nr:MAG: ribosome maturation factor RimP [Thiotrichaceae bacterium IS1]
MLKIDLLQLLTPAITALGYELWGIENLPQGRQSRLLRIYIDSPTGITLADCERVSYQISGLLEVEDPIPGPYILEVSSPGLDRLLFTLAHFERFVGHKLTIKLTHPLATRRNFTGILQRVEDHNLIILADDIEYNLRFEQIERARLVPDTHL